MQNPYFSSINIDCINRFVHCSLVQLSLTSYHWHVPACHHHHQISPPDRLHCCHYCSIPWQSKAHFCCFNLMVEKCNSSSWVRWGFWWRWSPTGSWGWQCLLDLGSVAILCGICPDVLAHVGQSRGSERITPSLWVIKQSLCYWRAEIIKGRRSSSYTKNLNWIIDWGTFGGKGAMQLCSGRRRRRWFVIVLLLPPVAFLITTTACWNGGDRFCVTVPTILLISFGILGGVPFCSGGGVFFICYGVKHLCTWYIKIYFYGPTCTHKHDVIEMNPYLFIPEFPEATFPVKVMFS